MTPLLIACPNCGHALTTDGALQGSEIRCPECGKTFIVPSADPQPAMNNSVGAGAKIQSTEPTYPNTNGATGYLPPDGGFRYGDPPPVATPTRPLSIDPPPSRPTQPRRQPSTTLSAPIPAALLMPEKRLQALAAVVGIPVGMVVSVLIAILGRHTMAGEVFSLHRFSSIIPMAIMSLFFWSVMICVFRLRRVQALEALTSERNMADAVAALVSDGVQSQAEVLANHPLCDVHPLYRRIRAVLQQWQLRPSLHDADILLQKNEVADEDTIHAGYSLLRTFIWSMPVLGLIGTVIGISLAVGGFANFLGGSVEDVVKIKTSLVGVTTGLSFAFLITLEGLLAALLTMVPASALESREANLNTTIQRFLTDRYLPRLGSTEAADDGLPNNQMREAWRRAMQEVADEVLRSVRGAATAVLTEMAEYRRSQRIEAEQWIEKLGDMIVKVNQQYGATTDEFLHRLSLVSEVMSKDRSDFMVGQKALLDGQREQSQALISALRTQSMSITQAADTLEQLVTVTNNALEEQKAIVDTVAQIGKLDMPGLATVIESYSRILHDAQSQMTDFSGAVRNVLDSQASLQGAVSQLEEIGFNTTLTQFRETLARLAPLLKVLVRPQLVLVSNPNEEEEAV